MLAVPSHSPLTLGPRNLPRVFPGTSASTPDTFILPRRQVLWPQLATSSSGTWGWAADASCIFGGYWFNSSGALNDRLNFENVALFSGPVKLNILHTTAGGGGLISVYWGEDKLGEFDNRTSSVTRNSVLLNLDLGTVSAGRKQLSFRIEGTTGSGYSLRIQQLEIIQPTGTNLGTSIDDLPWFGDIPPICYDTSTGPLTLVNSTQYMWGSRLQIASAQNHYAEYKVWMPQGSIELSMVSSTFSSWGIATVSLNGVDVGTMDFYSPSVVENQTKTCSFSVPSTGVQTIRITAKTTSGSGYGLVPYWISWRKTAATGAITPTGTTYGVGTRELWPWFADSHLNFDNIILGSSYLHYGGYYATNSIGNYLEHSQSLLSGNYSATVIATKRNFYGTGHFKLDIGASLGTVDFYDSGTLNNQRVQTDIDLTPGSLRLSIDSKNPLSSQYVALTTMTRLVRTGA